MSADRYPGIKFLVFALICSAGAVWLFQIITNLRFGVDEVRYDALVSDVAGLSPNDTVRLSGVIVGRVRDLQLDQGQARVTFDVDRDLPVTDAWEVGVRWRNVIGQRFLYLYPADEGSPLEPGSTIPPERTRAAVDIGVLLDRLQPVLQAVDPAAANDIVDALGEALVGSEERTRALVDDFGSLTSAVAARDEQIGALLADANTLLSAYAEEADDLDTAIGALADLSGTLAARNDELVAAISDVADFQERVGSLLADNDAELRGITDDLATLADSVGDNRADFEASIATLRDGLGTYLLVSRWGQWFNIRGIATQVADGGQVISCSTEAGTPCSEPNAPAGTAASGDARGGDGLRAVVLPGLLPAEALGEGVR